MVEPGADSVDGVDADSYESVNASGKNTVTTPSAGDISAGLAGPVDNSVAAGSSRVPHRTRKTEVDTVNRRPKGASVFIKWKGERKTIGEWSDTIGVSEHVLRSRKAQGWSTRDILTQPLRKRRKVSTDTVPRVAVTFRLKSDLHERLCEVVRQGEFTGIGDALEQAVKKFLGKKPPTAIITTPTTNETKG